MSGRNRGDYAFVVAIQVLHCRMKRTKKDYAIKVMLISFIQKEQKVPFVLTEKRIQSELSHPNIVKLTYAFKDPQYLFMVMELCAAELLGVIWCVVCYDRVDAPRYVISCLRGQQHTPRRICGQGDQEQGHGTRSGEVVCHTDCGCARVPPCQERRRASRPEAGEHSHLQAGPGANH